ncbi:class I SAM-dependent methyltransferase [Desulfogranum japonicum]|uniref:hypothetical protein n=1 Tax=Desulfogranum japonicum TaxID=231447 RepID=UPI0004038D6B|nr:hypothetical protein [Desulfogranum japonicum]
MAKSGWLFIIGEVEHKFIYFNEIYRVLKENGILSITELAGDPDKIDMDELQALVCEHGFEVFKIFGNHRNYTVNFKKKGKL